MVSFQLLKDSKMGLCQFLFQPLFESLDEDFRSQKNPNWFREYLTASNRAEQFIKSSFLL